MADLHVVSVRYALHPSDCVSYTNPSPVEFETDEARFRLAEGKLTCDMKAHFPTVDEARRTVEPTLRAWEVDADLRWGRSELRFTFDGAEVIDRTPAPPGVTHISAILAGATLVFASGTVSVSVSRANYPAPPPATFRLNPDAESILARYRGYLDGREPLLSMAYFCLTVVECKFGNARRSHAAAAYRIDLPVLNKMGELTSERGDALNARKASATQPLTSAEHAWLEQTVKMLIWRLGNTRNAAALPMITMSELPSLEPPTVSQ